MHQGAPLARREKFDSGFIKLDDDGDDFSDVLSAGMTNFNSIIHVC